MTEANVTDRYPQPVDKIRNQAIALAQHLQRSGVQFVPKPNADRVSELQTIFAPAASQLSATAEVATSPDPTRVDPTSTVETTSPSHPAPKSRFAPAVLVEPVAHAYAGASQATPDRIHQLDSMAKQVADCRRCEVLAACRKNTVFGEGNPNPRIAFFGEGPGADEDQTGRPFVGKAGQLLTKMIEACSLAREDVYILNAVKCRPPGNRNPEPLELQNCRGYFERQFSILRPEYIVCLGAISSQALLQSKLPVGKLRGKLYRYFESKVVVTYHPAYLLRNPDAKKAAWQDLQLMLRDAGIDVAKKG